MNSGINQSFLVRKLIHLITGLGFVVVADNSIKISLILGTLVISAVILDVTRNLVSWWNREFLSIFGKFLKEFEKQGKFTGASSLWIGLYFAYLIFPLNIFQISASVAVVADPFAALGGKIIPSPVIRMNRTMAGSVFFICVAVLLFTQYWNIPLIPAFFISILLGLVELYSSENIENFLITFGGTLIVYVYSLL